MSLRSKLLLVALSLLVLPWAGWQLLRQMEALLRQGQEQALVASAEALARAVLARPGALPPSGPGLYVHALPRPPSADGRFDDWRGIAPRAFRAGDGIERLRLALGRIDDTLWLRVEVDVARRQPADAHWPTAESNDHLRLDVDGAMGAMALRLANAESGWLRVVTADGAPSPLVLRGVWRERGGGFDVELALPQGFAPERLGLQASISGERDRLVVGTASESSEAAWPLLARSERLARPLRPLLPAAMRARLVAVEGWVLAEAGGLPEVVPSAELPWWRRQLYQWLLYAADPWSLDDDDAARSDRPEVWQALSGVPATAWRRERIAPRLLLSAAVPIRDEAGIRGALLLEREHQTLLLTDRALGGLVGSTLLAMLAAGGVLIAFASRLSWRIGRLRNAAENALGGDGRVRAFPRSDARDEIGDLSRSFARMLDEIATSQDYLRGLAGKLSHELNTPLAIVRGALDNVDPARVDAETKACLERARSGSDRLAAIVRAMSEASRLEQAIASAEPEEVDLRALLEACTPAYASLLAPRRLDLVLPAAPLRLNCVPELIQQALDKLIDNARGFTPADGWVRIALRAADDGAVLQVANRGPRLPEAMRHRLFESMVSLRGAQPGGGVHLGLGLHIVRLIAELHRGEASAADLADGGGVEFSLRLRSMARRR